MTEHEYEEWFDKKLGNIESLSKSLEADSPFLYAPTALKRGKWIFVCAISFLGCLFGSWFMAYIYQAINYWIWNWLSNLLLNFSIGLIASIAIMSYTNTRDKTIAFYTDIIPVIEKRINDLRSAYDDYSLKLEIKYQSKNYQDAYEAWHVSSNTCFVILEYIRFLIRMLPAQITDTLPTEEQLEKASGRILAANRKIQEEYFESEFFSKETCAECVQVVDWGMFALGSLDQFLTSISGGLYGLKYSKMDQKKFEEYNWE